jgi:hypothetical protein
MRAGSMPPSTSSQQLDAFADGKRVRLGVGAECGEADVIGDEPHDGTRSEASGL